VRNTGAVIVRRFQAEALDPVAVPGVLVAGHAPFTWGKTAAAAVEHADVLEYIARLAFRTVQIRQATGFSSAFDSEIPAYVSEHHYLRKHGPKATYGQGLK
jgi:L-ribulose-5-phosphate 4-epimerase